MRYFVLKDEDRRLDVSTRSALRGSFVKLTDGITHYELCGPENGEIVVLVGGLTVPLFYWNRITVRLHEAGFRTLTYSTYGRGYSDRVKGPYNDTLFTRQLSEIVRWCVRGKKYHIVGASMGALIAMGHAIQNAAAVTTLTIAGPAGLSKKPVVLRWLQRSDSLMIFFARYFGRKWLESHEKNDLGDRTHAAELSAMLKDAYRYQGSIYALFDTLQNFPLFDRQDLYQSVGDSSIPTMLIWGKEDRVTPIDKIDDAKALLRPRQCHILACGHMAPFEHTRVVADNIVSFVDATQNRG